MRQVSRPVIAALGVFASCALLLALLLPVWNQKQAASERLRVLQKQADAVAAKVDELLLLKQLPQSAGARTRGTLFSEVDGITVQLGIRQSVTAIKPSSNEENGTSYERVSITAAGLYQQKGVAFLHALEKTGRGIQIEHCAIRRSKENLWDIALTARRAVRMGSAEKQ